MWKRGKRQAGKQLVSDALQLPFESLSNGISQIELLGNSEAVIEGCQGILEYNDIMIRVAIHKMQVKFTGTDLSIKCLNSENIIIQGTIRMVEYLD